jgi:hypothetical protein
MLPVLFARVSGGLALATVTAAALLLGLTLLASACGLPESAADSLDDDGPPSGRASVASPARPGGATGADAAEGEGTAGAGPFVPYAAGLPVAGQVGADGGALSRLLFAVVGDSRPATVDDTNGYPAHVVATLFSDIAALRPRPPMVLSTGDYVFASASRASRASPPGASGQAAPQLDVYLQARARFPGAFFPAMGNHECTGATSSNCGAGASSGEPSNYAAFVDKMLAPIGEAAPYYAIDVVAPDAAWTAKFVFVAANAWSGAQEAWLESTMARPSTYTFVVRHEPATADAAPGVTPSEAIMARHPYTLAIVGHSHTYRHDVARPREVLIGNGGAPLSSKDYGFGVFSQRSNGVIDVDMLDWQTGRADASFHFAVKPDGAATP